MPASALVPGSLLLGQLLLVCQFPVGQGHHDPLAVVARASLLQLSTTAGGTGPGSFRVAASLSASLRTATAGSVKALSGSGTVSGHQRGALRIHLPWSIFSSFQALLK